MFWVHGCRASTILNIKISDIDFHNENVILRKMKNRKQLCIPLSRTLLKVLHEYLSIRKGNAEDYLFCTEYGQQLSLRGLQTAIKNYNHRRGVKKVSIHLFRHYFATQWLLNGRRLGKIATNIRT